MKEKNMKWDGHTHTELCRHGSGDSTAKMVERAIQQGFTVYSITEHAPVPEGLIGDREFELELGMADDEVQSYFDLVKDLKRVYGQKIEIRSGLEVDYLPGYEAFTKEQLKEWNHHLDEILFSIHFMPGKGGMRCIDFKPDDFRDGLLSYYGDITSVHDAYWKMVKEMLQVHLGFNKPIRIGHLALIYKFYEEFPLEKHNHFSTDFFKEILTLVKEKQYSLDYNMAGTNQKLWGHPYMLDPILYWCNQLDIELVYGSDAHRLESVGQGYAQFEEQIKKLKKQI